MTRLGLTYCTSAHRPRPSPSPIARKTLRQPGTTPTTHSVHCADLGYDERNERALCAAALRGRLARAPHPGWSNLLLQHSDQGHAVDQARGAYDPGRGMCRCPLMGCMSSQLTLCPVCSARLPTSHGKNTRPRAAASTGTTPRPSRARGRCLRSTRGLLLAAQALRRPQRKLTLLLPCPYHVC
jgi:hypothetical protein